MLKRKILTFEWILIIYFGIQTLWPEKFSLQSSLMFFGIILIVKHFQEGFRLNIFLFLASQAIFALTQIFFIRLALIALSVVSVLYFPMYRFPDTMGLFFAGFKLLKLRNNTECSVYYPTTTLTDPVNYVPSKRAWLRFHRYLKFSGSKLPSWIFHLGLSFLNYVQLPVQFESPIISKEHLTHGKKFPVILVSHGMACNRNLYTTFAREWASNGYIVFSVDHEESIDLPTGYSTKELNAFRFVQVKKRKEAILRVLDYISNPDNIQDFFDNSGTELDLTRVSVVGQSFGGAAAAYTAMADKRINGVCILLDPDLESVYEEMKGKSVNMPLLIIRTQSLDAGILRGKDNKEMIFELVANNKEKLKQSMSCSFDKASHISQTDLVLHMPREIMMFNMMKDVNAVEDFLILNNRLTQNFLDIMLYEKDPSGGFASIDTVVRKFLSFAKKVPRGTKLIVDKI